MLICFRFLFTFFFSFLKIIKESKDAFTVVRYHFKEPFVTRTLQIFPDVGTSKAVFLRTEIYGCRPTPGNGIIIVY